MPIFDLDYANPMNKLTAKFNRQNMLRELTTLMQSYDEPLTFESLNSRGTTLLPVGNKPLNDVLEEMIEQTEQGDDIVKNIFHCGTQLFHSCMKIIPVMIIVIKLKNVLTWR